MDVGFTIGINLRYHFYFILNSLINFNIPLFCVQVKRLVNKLKTSPLTMYKDEDRSPERHSIHGNSPSPVRHQGNMGSLSQYSNLQSSNLAKQNQQSPEQNNAVPFMGANIDRIPERMPLGNRSPPRTVHGNGGNQ